jgi:hypothetical protein
MQKKPGSPIRSSQLVPANPTSCPRDKGCWFKGASSLKNHESEETKLEGVPVEAVRTKPCPLGKLMPCFLVPSLALAQGWLLLERRALGFSRSFEAHLAEQITARFAEALIFGLRVNLV